MPEHPPIYLDHNATTPVDPRALQAMLPYFCDAFGNAASRQHAIGRAAAKAVDRARQRIAALIGAGPRDIVLTSGATESNNLALKGAAAWYGRQGGRGRHIVTTAVEHKAVLDPLRRLQDHGFHVTHIRPPSDGVITAEHVAPFLRDDTILVSVMWANNETGVINDVPAIGRLCRDRRVILHTDATQYAGKMPIDVDEAHVDMLSFSAHKLYGPKGVGALYVRRRRPRVRLTPLIDGGGHERGMRSGTLNVPAIVGFGAAAELCLAEMHADAQRLAALRDRLENAILDTVPGAAVNGHRDRRLPHTANISFGDIDAERLMAALPGLALSNGAACTSTALDASYVLRRMGLGDARARSSLRFGLGRINTEADVDAAIEQILHAVAHADLSAPACEPAIE